MMNRNRTHFSAASALGLLIGLTGSASGEVTFEWVTVGNAGNAPDPLANVIPPGSSSVAYEFRIAKYETTNDQYVEFLNAVAAMDTNELFNPDMDNSARGGIIRTGISGSFSYEVKSNMGRKPVNYVSFFDAMRFVNWLHNGQPTGAQDASTTETGVYAIDDGLSEERAPGARFAIPTEDEWYKSAYHQPAIYGGDADDFWRYPTASNDLPAQAAATAVGDIANPGPNVANYDSGADWNGRDGNVTTVGSAGSGSESYYGTFDQGGNVFEWNEAVLVESSFRGFRGGSMAVFGGQMGSSTTHLGAPTQRFDGLGIRVASPICSRTADLSGDGDVDVEDFAVMWAAFTGPMPPDSVCGFEEIESSEAHAQRITPPGASPDLDVDGDVDVRDFALMQTAFTGSSSVVPVCGNGIIEIGEECDDGNMISGDGCNADCQSEAGSCGDGVLAILFEECDDGNLTSGDGCDEHCLIEPPANDECVDAIAVFDGDTSFDNINATTDGPDEPTVCDFGVGTTQIDGDVWFCYESTCSGTVVTSLCGSDYDTELAVYEGCACPPAQAALGCSDDDCGAAGFDSRLTFPAVQGQSYSIRIGGFSPGSQGFGTLTILCDEEPVCGPSAGDCFATEGNGSRACDDTACCETTCAVDPFCCDVVWDATCAAEAQGLCTGSFPVCSTSTGACETGNVGPGCANEACCNSVCVIDPFCCTDAWDDFCATEAASICGFNCGTEGTRNNNACSEVAVPGTNFPLGGCSDETACRDVCAEAPDCCVEAWDQRCVCLADPSDPCCAAVCAQDWFCCETEWDELCDLAAVEICAP